MSGMSGKSASERARETGRRSPDSGEEPGPAETPADLTETPADLTETPADLTERPAGPAGTPDPIAKAWRDVVATARRSAADGLVVGTSGNVSARVGDTVLVTPSGVPYDRLGPGDAVGVDLDGRQILGDLAPTSELPLHLAVYADTGAAAVVHTHAVHATAVSTLVAEVPLVHYAAALLGGPVRTAAYARYGTPELADAMRAALRDRTGCLLANHGTVTYGDTLDQAYERTAQLEWLCRLWLTASSVPGHRPGLLTPAQLDEAAEALRSYGQPR